MAGKLQLRKWRKGTFLLVVAVAGMLGTAPASAATTCANADLMPTAGAEADATAALVCVINEFRAANGLTTLKANRRLTRAALRHSADMISQGYFAHESRNGDTMVSRARSEGYLKRARAWWVAENLAWGTRELTTAASVLQAWLDSPPHRANLLYGKARELGLGVLAGSPTGVADGAVFTLLLGRRS